jgi:hypothetical protein
VIEITGWYQKCVRNALEQPVSTGFAYQRGVSTLRSSAVIPSLSA